MIALASKRCTCCARVKPTEAFGSDRSKPDRLATRCRVCRTAKDAVRRRTPNYQATYRERADRLSVKLAKRAASQRRRDQRQAEHRAYRQTGWGRLVINLGRSRRRLEQARAEGKSETAAKLKRLIAAYQSEIRRIQGA